MSVPRRARARVMVGLGPGRPPLQLSHTYQPSNMPPYPTFKRIVICRFQGGPGPGSWSEKFRVEPSYNFAQLATYKLCTVHKIHRGRPWVGSRGMVGPGLCPGRPPLQLCSARDSKIMPLYPTFIRIVGWRAQGGRYRLRRERRSAAWRPPCSARRSRALLLRP
jgi:hypothetical protein